MKITVGGLMKAFDKKYKKPLGTMGVRDDEPTRLQTGMFALDLATGGGFPEGRVTLIFGPESAAKTTTSLKAIAAAQQQYPERTCAFVDIEGHLDRKWAATLGVDVDRLAHIIPENAEQTVDIVEALLAAEDISLIVLDSLAAMQTQAELEKDAEEATPGRSALIINKLYRKITHALNAARVEGGFMPTLVVINQIRFKIGGSTHQDPETMPGGPAFKFVSSLTLRLYGKDEGKADNNKNLPAFKKTTFTIRKHKIPIVAKTCEVFLALADNAETGLKKGEVGYFNTALGYLKQFDLFTKAEGKGAQGWNLVHPGTGELLAFKTQDDLKTRMREDAVFRREVLGGLIAKVRDEDGVVEAEEA